MQSLFRSETKEGQDNLDAKSAWSTRVLGFVGSVVIFWIVLKELAPLLIRAWGIAWIGRSWVRVVLAALVAVPFSAWLARIEGSIWGKYYVIIGYLLCLALIVWIALRLLHYL